MWKVAPQPSLLVGGASFFLRTCFLFCSLAGPTIPLRSSVLWLFGYRTSSCCPLPVSDLSSGLPLSPQSLTQLTEARMPWAILAPSCLFLTWLLCAPSPGSLSDYSCFGRPPDFSAVPSCFRSPSSHSPLTD